MFNIFGMLGYLIAGKTPNMNNFTANDYYSRLQLIALSLFEWQGLPETCNARHLEKTLYLYGRALFYQDPDNKKFWNAKCTPSGTVDHYDEAVSYDAVSPTYNHTFKKNECILVRNNYLERPTDDTVMLFASRLTEAERTIDVNIRAQKTPVLITCDEKDRLSVENIYKKFDENEKIIVGSKSLDINLLKVLKTDAPYVADKLQNYKHEIWNEALTFLGVNNANSDKRERLITDEVNANNEVISVNAQSMLLTRIEACKQINKMYGLDVSVKMRDFEGQNRESEGEVEE